MIVLDSSAIIAILGGTKKGEEIKQKFQEETFAVTTISVEEVLIGFKENYRPLILNFFKSMEILSFDCDAAYKCVEVQTQLQKKGRMIGKFDIYIASICLVHGLSIVTLDSDFEVVPSLSVIKL